jgi:citrate synthase
MDSGLAGLIAAETVLSHSDGARGILWVRGHTVPELVADFGYEGAVGLLWEGFAGSGLGREEMRVRLGAGRMAAFARLGEWLEAAKSRPFIEGLRLALAALPETATPAEILATLPVAIAALLRERNGEAPLPPDPARGTADDLLRMVHGKPVPPVMAEALDAYFTAVFENGLNTSAFTARVIVSSRASLASAALGAYCAFTGPLHGDPRSLILRQALEKLGQALGPGAGRLAFAAEVERAVADAFAKLKPGRPPLQPNIEINAALLLDAVGLPREAFTPMFATARCAGWLAHAMEQQKEGRLVRPSSAYIGPVPTGAQNPG